MIKTTIFPPKYTNEIEGSDTIYGICRCGTTCFNRVFEDVDSAVETLIAKGQEMMPFEEGKKPATFEVIKGVSTIHKAVIKPDSSIIYSIRDGVEVELCKSKKPLIINHPLPENILPAATEDNTIYNMKTANIFTESELMFLALQESEVTKMANAVQTAVVDHRKSETICNEVLEISQGMVMISTTKAWAEGMPAGEYAVDDKHVLFKSWQLFKTCFGVRNSGKKPLDRVADTIIAVWKKGNELHRHANVPALVEEVGVSTVATPITVEEKSEATATTPSPVVEPATTAALPETGDSKPSAQEYIAEVVNSVLVFVSANDLMLAFLNSKGLSLESEISAKSSGLFSCALTKGVVTISSPLGFRDIPVENRTIDDIKTFLSRELAAILLILSATAPDKVASLFDASSLASLYQPLVDKFAA